MRPKIFGFEMVSCFRKRKVGIREFSSIETKSCHTFTRVLYVIGYTKCTKTPKIIPYLAAPLVGGGFTHVGIPYTQTEGRTEGWATVVNLFL